MQTTSGFCTKSQLSGCVLACCISLFSVRIKPFKKSKSSDFLFNVVHSLKINVVLGIENLQQRTENCV